MNLPDTIRTAIHSHGLISSGDRVVVGVSGGADSVALLRVLHHLGFPVSIAHLNHQLRGAEADADELFVRNLATELNLPITVERTDVRSLAVSEIVSLEMAARLARHRFFETFEGAVIALAHHADDQVETFFMRLARGAGVEGLSGMAYQQQIGPLRLIRPMLAIPRAVLIDWLQAGRYDWCEDASNSEPTFLRNRIRNTIVPLLEKELNPNIRKTILRTLDILREENTFVDAAACRVACDSTPPNVTRLEAAATLQQPLALQRRIVRKWLFEQGATEASFDTVEQILTQMASGEGTTVFELNERQRVVMEYGVPRFEESRQKNLLNVRLTIETGTGWCKDHGQGAGILPAEASFDAKKVGDSPVEVRSFQPGDRMQPLGMDGSRKLQDIFTDQKIPRAQRSSIPVVLCRGEIIWLPGYRIARGWEVPGPEAHAVHVRVE